MLTSSSKPTSAVVNIVIAIPYPVRQPSALSKPAKIGVGVGSAIGGIVIVVLLVLLFVTGRKRRKDKNVVQAARDVLRSRPAAVASTQSNTLMQDEDYPKPRWATIVRPPYPPPAGGSHPGGFDGDGGVGGYAGYTPDLGYAGHLGYRGGPDPQYQDAIELQGDEHHEAPQFYYQSYSDYPRPQ